MKWYGLIRPYHFKLFKGCSPQILLGPFLNTLIHILYYPTQSCISFNILPNIHPTISEKCFKLKHDYVDNLFRNAAKIWMYIRATATCWEYLPHLTRKIFFCFSFFPLPFLFLILKIVIRWLSGVFRCTII